MPTAYFMGKRQVRWINPKHIVELRVVKSRPVVYASGDTDGDVVHVKDLDYKEPYAVEVITTKGTHYINFDTEEEARDKLMWMAKGLTKSNRPAAQIIEYMEDQYGEVERRR